MKKTYLILAIFILSAVNVNSCTTFVLKYQNQLVFGRNLDWVSDVGLIIVNKRNVWKQSLVFAPDKPMEWTSKYGSVTFNQFGKEFPYGGINEKGLVIEIMCADVSYPEFDDRPAVNELQWIQYQLDNSENIEDIIKSDSLLRISKISQDLHFLVCDKNGNVAVIEFEDNKMIVYQGENLPIPVLENDMYSVSQQKHAAGGNNRFTRATNMINSYNPANSKSIVNYSFKILDEVIAGMPGLWSIVYDIKNMKIHFTSSSNKNIQKIDVLKFDFSCNVKNKMYNLRSIGVGEINKRFFSFSSKINKNIMAEAIKTNMIYLPDEILQRFYNYHGTCKCLKN